jgi:aspartyl-tRNA(Asn)/glutamyl-tRNA(Gln) amidotransferase subunit B
MQRNPNYKRDMNYEAVIGLEVHVHLKTKTKAFCGCSTEFGKEANTQACPVCLGFPGSLPVLNKVALDYAVRVALALNCQVSDYTKFDRKNYFYPDLPKNYQISQYDLPLSKDGYLDIDSDGQIKRIGIRRVHLEEDAGKLIHQDVISLVDFNRAGIPLLEIVSQPQINSPQEAYEYLTTLKSIIEYLEVSDCDMEKGSLRCDANISVREKGQKQLGRKTELKNMNSFKAVKDALTFEIGRQAELLKRGKSIVQETRLWDAKELKTFSMRTKEEAMDYRYFPEPDLPPFMISPEKIAEIRMAIPELPKEKMQRFIEDYGLLEYDAKVLVLNKNKWDAEYAEALFKAYPPKDKKPVVNLLIGALSASANSRKCSISDLNMPVGNVIELTNYIETQQISNLTANSVLEEMIETKKSAAQIIKEKDLIQISDTNSLNKIIEEVLKENPASAQDYKSGKTNAIMFLVGQAMKKTKGRANPKVVQDILKKLLK